MEPIKLEILLDDQTRKGITGVEGNLDGMKLYVQNVIKQLETQLQGLESRFKSAFDAGISTDQDMAEIQALKGVIGQLKEELKELDAIKKQTNETPVVDDKTIDDQAILRKTNNLKMSFQQVARELPSLAFGPQMFILAISNNLPMLTDAIAQVSKQNEILRASGQKTTSVARQLASSLFSWQTGLVTAISLYLIFNKQINEWINSLGKGKNAAISLADAQQKVNDTFLDDNSQLGEQIVQIRSLSDRWKQLGNDLDEKKKFIKDNRDELDKLGVSVENVADAENLLSTNTEAYITAMSLRAKAAAAYKLASEQAETAIKKQIEIEKAQASGPSFLDKLASAASAVGAGASYAGAAYGQTQTAEQAREARIDDLEREKKAAEDTQQAYTDLYSTLTEEARKAMEEAGIHEKEGARTTQGKDYVTMLAEARLEAQRKLERARIEVLQDGMEKRKQLLAQELQEELDAIEKERTETVRKLDEAKKAGVAVSDTDYSNATQNANERKLIAQKIYAQKLQLIDAEYWEQQTQDMLDYLKEYGSFGEKRMALAADYARKIAKAETDYARQSLAEQRDIALQSLDFEQLKQTIDWSSVFGELDRQSTEALQQLRDRLTQYIEGIDDDISPESFKEVMDAVKQIDDVLVQRTPYQSLLEGYQDYIDAVAEVKRAKEELQQVEQTGSIVIEEYDEQTGTITRKLLTQAEAEERLQRAQDSRYAAQVKLTKAVNEIASQGNAVVQAGSDIVDMLTSLGIEVPEAIQSTLQGLNTVTQSLGQIDFTKPFSVLTGITGTLKGIGQIFGGLFGIGESSTERYEKLKESLEKLNSLYDTIIDKEKEAISFGGGFANVEAAANAMEVLNKQLENYRTLANAAGQAGSGLFKHSYAYRTDKAIGTEGFREISSLLEKNIDSVTDLYNLSGEELYNVMSQLPEVWNVIDENIRQYLEDIIELKDEAEEIKQALAESLTGVTQDSFYNNFIEGLADMEMSFDDMCDNFETQLRKSIIAGLVASQYKTKINQLYDAWAKAAETDGISSDEATSLQEAYRKLVEEMIKQRDEMADAFGWTSGTGSSQSGQAGAFTSMTQDQGTKLEGLFTSVQIHLINIDNWLVRYTESVSEQRNSLSQIAVNTSYCKHLEEIRDILNDIQRNGLTLN